MCTRCCDKTKFQCVNVRYYLGGERNIERIAIFDPWISISIQNRESGIIERDLDLLKDRKITIQNRKPDIDLQQCSQRQLPGKLR